MTIADQQTESRFFLDTNWEGYLKILNVVGERPIKVTYDRGRLELMSPGKRHQKRSRTLGSLITGILHALRLPMEPGGGMTFKREELDRGFEPDECFWIANYETVVHSEEWDPHRDPPPDLAIEVEVTSGLIKRLPLYHAMRIPEVWRWTAEDQLIFLGWREGEYAIIESSRAFPWLKPDLIRSFALRALEQSLPLIMDDFMAEVRQLASS